MVAAVSSGAGFLFAVLWFDLMFDLQVFGHPGRPLSESVLRQSELARSICRDHLVCAVCIAAVFVIQLTSV